MLIAAYLANHMLHTHLLELNVVKMLACIFAVAYTYNHDIEICYAKRKQSLLIHYVCLYAVCQYRSHLLHYRFVGVYAQTSWPISTNVLANARPNLPKPRIAICFILSSLLAYHNTAFRIMNRIFFLPVRQRHRECQRAYPSAEHQKHKQQFAHRASCGVIPQLNPTVPNAETHSYRIVPIVAAGLPSSMMQMIKVAVSTNTMASTVMAAALQHQIPSNAAFANHSFRPASHNGGRYKQKNGKCSHLDTAARRPGGCPDEH